MIELTVLFIVAFFLNFVWEVWHSQLYTTCLSMRLPAYIRLITWQTLKDAFWIVLCFLIVQTVFVGADILSAVPLATFTVALLVFSFVVEWHAIHTKRWEYALTMPRFLGVGATPLLELAVTGFASLFLVFGILGV